MQTLWAETLRETSAPGPHVRQTDTRTSVGRIRLVRETHQSDRNARASSGESRRCLD